MKMTRDEAKEMLPIIQAYAEGKTIQFLNGGKWYDVYNTDFYQYNFLKIDLNLLFVFQYHYNLHLFSYQTTKIQKLNTILYFSKPFF